MTESVQAEADSDNEKAEVMDAVERLPKEFKDVILMHYFYDMKLQEIAASEGISLPLVKYRLKRGKEMLKSFLG